jgi:hypothetical protein
MNTNVDADRDLAIPEFDFDRAHRVGGPARRHGEAVEVRIDGAVSYSLRLIPSNKIVGRFASTIEAWPAVIGEIDRGMPARCLVLDADLETGERHRLAAGKLLLAAARRNVRRGTARRAVAS